MLLPKQGMSKEQVLGKLEDLRQNDVKWRNGKLFGGAFHVSNEMEDVVGDAFRMYMWDNALDPRDIQSVLQMERDVMSIAAAHLGGDDNVVGSFTSGGTESVLLAVKTARDWSRKHKPHITEPEIIIPITAHACFHKAAQYFGLKAVVVPVNTETFAVEASVIEEAITPNTILLMGSAPSYAHGTIDPIEEIAALALKHDLLCHVDGCVGGWLLPFFREAGADVPAFDFSVPGVTSMSMDFHKYAYAAKGASIVLYRNPELRLNQIFTCSGWTGYTIVNPTIQSSKSGGPVAGAWAALNYMGHDGYLNVAKELLKTTQEAVAAINATDGLHIMGTPAMCLLAFGSDNLNLFQLSDSLKERGWSVQPQNRKGDVPESIHLTINPLNIPNMAPFMDDLQAAVKEVWDAPKVTDPDLVGGLAAMPADLEMDPETMKGMFAMLGIEGGGIPGRMAVINEIINVLPTQLADKFLTFYFNELTRYRRDEA